MSFDKTEYEGVVTAAKGNGMFEVDHEGGNVICTISGKIRKNNIRILPGDRVRFEMSLYDINSTKKKGRIVYRSK